MKIKIHGLSNFSEDQKVLISHALMVGEMVLSSSVFKEKIVLANYSEDRGYSSREIYDLIMSGKDPQADGSKPQDYVLDIDITGFKDSSSTIGYTNLNGFKMYFNKTFLDIFAVDGSEIFGHVMHETMHKFGFAHRKRWSRSKSVPYVVGYRSRDAYKQFLKEDKPMGSSFVGVPQIEFQLV